MLWIRPKFIINKSGKRITKKKKIKGLFFKKVDIQSNKMKSLKLKLDGATCIQTLSVLDDYKKTVKFAKRLGSKFICVNSLFWKVEIDFKISVNFLKKNSKDFIKVNHYNIYSLSHYIKYLNKIGFKKHFILKFTKLKTKKQNLMGSHTVNLNGKSVAIWSTYFRMVFYFKQKLIYEKNSYIWQWIHWHTPC